MPTPITLIAADDHPIFLQGLVLLFEQLPWVQFLGSAIEGDGALSLINTHQPDIALIDLSMPGASIETLIDTVETANYSTQIIALTMLDDAYHVNKLLSLGLSGYVLKDTAFEDLLTAIKIVAAGEPFISPSLIKKIQEQQDKVVDIILTDREAQVLTSAAKGNGNKQIAYDLSISERTVCFHMANCFVKLGVSNRMQAVTSAINLAIIQPAFEA